MTVHYLRLDVRKPPGSRSVVRVRQGEFGSTTVVAEVVDGDSAMDLDGYEATFEMRQPRGGLVQEPADVASGGRLSYTLSRLATSMPGLSGIAYFALRKAADGGGPTSREWAEVLTTEAFAVEVLPEACSEGVGVASVYVSEIERMLAACEDDYSSWAASARAECEDAAEAAAEAAAAAAELVDQAVSGNLDPLFADYLEQHVQALSAEETEGIYEGVVADG